MMSQVGALMGAKRFFRRKAGETTYPRALVHEAPTPKWAPPWTCVTQAPHNAKMKVGSCHRESFAVVFPIENKRGETWWYWTACDAEGIEQHRDVAKLMCDLELHRKRIRLHENVPGCVFDEDDGPPAYYEGVQ